MLKRLTRMIKITVETNKEGSEQLALINMETCDSLKSPNEIIWKTKIKKNTSSQTDSGKINFRLNFSLYTSLQNCFIDPFLGMLI